MERSIKELIRNMETKIKEAQELTLELTWDILETPSMHSHIPKLENSLKQYASHSAKAQQYNEFLTKNLYLDSDPVTLLKTKIEAIGENEWRRDHYYTQYLKYKNEIIEKEDAEEEEEELQVTAQNTTFRCPLSQRIFEHPVMAPCGHSFSKNSIRSYLERNMICPVIGCRRQLKIEDLKPDKYTERKMRRRESDDLEAAFVV